MTYAALMDKQPEVETPTVVNLTLKVPETVRRSLKIVSALENRTMQEVGAEILTKGVEMKRKKPVG